MRWSSWPLATGSLLSNSTQHLSGPGSFTATSVFSSFWPVISRSLTSASTHDCDADGSLYCHHLKVSLSPSGSYVPAVLNVMVEPASASTSIGARPLSPFTATTGW